MNDYIAYRREGFTDEAAQRLAGLDNQEAWDRLLASYYRWLAVFAVCVLALGCVSTHAMELRVTYSHPAYGNKVVIQDSKQCVKDANALRARLIWVREFRAWCNGRRV